MQWGLLLLHFVGAKVKFQRLATHTSHRRKFSGNSFFSTVNSRWTGAAGLNFCQWWMVGYVNLILQRSCNRGRCAIVITTLLLTVSLYSFTLSFALHCGFNFDIVALWCLMHIDFQVIEPSVSFSYFGHNCHSKHLQHKAVQSEWMVQSTNSRGNKWSPLGLFVAGTNSFLQSSV